MDFAIDLFVTSFCIERFNVRKRLSYCFNVILGDIVGIE